jgi:hypothetical protein
VIKFARVIFFHDPSESWSNRGVKKNMNILMD